MLLGTFCQNDSNCCCLKSNAHSSTTPPSGSSDFHSTSTASGHRPMHTMRAMATGLSVGLQATSSDGATERPTALTAQSRQYVSAPAGRLPSLTQPRRVMPRVSVLAVSVAGKSSKVNSQVAGCHCMMLKVSAWIDVTGAPASSSTSNSNVTPPIRRVQTRTFFGGCGKSLVRQRAHLEKSADHPAPFRARTRTKKSVAAGKWRMVAVQTSTPPLGLGSPFADPLSKRQMSVPSSHCASKASRLNSNWHSNVSAPTGFGALHSTTTPFGLRWMHAGGSNTGGRPAVRQETVNGYGLPSQERRMV
mmetsp:Transcript_80486/g.202496  ORF Transcript_80486/g.202496 Transcript_80486/m.202496 type:complete len:304 (+) Transcript_80486:690-1601(+)|eukprot:CAMPEP_0115577394 /NCGR_PEP_ID=MMETSP0272-20121206/3050_1 /TAXON_ID=71861 /ORGANISM="Scrippsiella trochoidea, Strain CCMP3099" /LENGTH=303 /DNA_ID=CAMNT_0003012205 /DNA_START=394 /DNA_END=1305 /DNA_ORIENTATION=-